MTFQLSAEQEQLIRKAIEVGVIRNANDVLEVGIETIRQRLADRRQSGALEAGQWLREFHDWVHNHPTTTPLLSDEAINRDSIYGTRGM
jgi:hypothetical protein